MSATAHGRTICKPGAPRRERRQVSRLDGSKLKKSTIRMHYVNSHAEAAVAESGGEPGDFADADGVGRCRTWLRGEVGGDGVGGRAEHILADQVGRFDAWYRHTTLVLVAQAFLATVRAQTANGRPVGMRGS